MGELSDLGARVDRLLTGRPRAESARRMSWRTAASALLVAGCAAAVVFQPATFRFVQSLLERLIG
jgi:hypothetical protein